MDTATELEEALQALRDTIPTVVPGIHTDRSVFYSKEVVVQICEHYATGTSLHKISKIPGMPAYSTLQNWVKDRPEFREALSSMRELRALHYEDRAIDEVEFVENPKDVPAARLRSETYWKAAEVNDPARYGKKVTHEGSKANPIQIVVHTGWEQPLNEYQQSPTLGPDGLIIRPAKPVIEVKAEPPKEPDGVSTTERIAGASEPRVERDTDYEPRPVGSSIPLCSSDDVYAERTGPQPEVFSVPARGGSESSPQVRQPEPEKSGG